MNVDNGITGAQYLTWFFVIFGWGVTIFVARSVLRKNARNSWIGDIKKAFSELEDDSIEFWMGDNEENEIIKLYRLKRKVKEITTLANEIQSYGGKKYPLDEFIKLRKAITTECYHDEIEYKLVRSLLASDPRIFKISSVCAELTLIYIRK